MRNAFGVRDQEKTGYYMGTIILLSFTEFPMGVKGK
jgi:hypothetical protein